jgi:hypothetical protein
MCRFLEMSQQDVAHDRASGTLVDVLQYKVPQANTCYYVT